MVATEATDLRDVSDSLSILVERLTRRAEALASLEIASLSFFLLQLPVYAACRISTLQPKTGKFIFISFRLGSRATPSPARSFPIALLAGLSCFG